MGSGTRVKVPSGLVRVATASPPAAGERGADPFQICVYCSMIEQESNEADNSSRVPTVR